MRVSRTFLSAAGLAGLALLMTVGALAQGVAPPGPPPTSCSVGGNVFTVSDGQPKIVPCSGVQGGSCTEIAYQVTGSPKNVYALAGRGVVAVTPKASIAPPCEGQGSFGKGSCHEQAIRIQSSSGVQTFKITLAGLRLRTATSVALGPGNGDAKACTILGIGLEGGPDVNQTTAKTETVNFKGCVVEFTRDAATGDVLKAVLVTDTADNGEPCTGPSVDEHGVIAPLPIEQVALTLDGVGLGAGKFGDGFISAGTESCTTRVIGGRLYTWGAPCP
jgi:hypothetical protein